MSVNYLNRENANKNSDQYSISSRRVEIYIYYDFNYVSLKFSFKMSIAICSANPQSPPGLESLKFLFEEPVPG